MCRSGRLTEMVILSQSRFKTKELLFLGSEVDIFALADVNGQMLQAPEDYKELGIEAPMVQPGTRLWKANRDGKRYLLCTGRIADWSGHRLYQVTIGRPVA